MIKIIRNRINYLTDKGFFDLLVAKFLIQFLGFGTILLVAKFLTPTELGEIKIIQSYASIFIILAGFGFNTAVLKICSERSSLNEKEGVLKISFKRSLITSTITFLLLAMLAYSGAITSSIHIARWLVIYSITIPIMVITDIFIVFLQAQKKIKLMARIQAIIKLQSAIIIIICTWIWGFKGFIFSTIGAFAIGLIPLIWQVGVNFIKVPSKNTSRLGNYAIFSMLANLVNQIGQRGDIFILDHFLTDRDAIGYYSLATIFLMGATQVTGVVQQIITPYFSERSADKRWVTKNLTKNILRMIGLSICVAISVFLAAWFIIHFLFAAQYTITLKYLSILLLKYIVSSTSALIGATLVGLGFMRFNFLVVLVSTPIALILYYYGLTHYGVIGIAWFSVLAAMIKTGIIFMMLMIIWKFCYR